MSLGHGIVRALFAANDIISGTAPASGGGGGGGAADRSRPRTGDRERHRHVCHALVRVAIDRERVLSARREVSAKYVYRDPGNNYR